MGEKKCFSVIDVEWIARRFVGVHKTLRFPTSRKLRSFQTYADSRVKGVFNDVSKNDIKENLEVLKSVIESLFENVGLNDPDWQREPRQESLPMVALVPGIGCGVIYARTADGHWLLEDPSGSQRLHLLPQNAIYAEISAPQGREQLPTARALFKSALVAHKGIFAKAMVASFLINLLAVATSLYSMQVYDRVIPTQAVSTLVVLTTGVGIAVVIELLIKLARSAILERSVERMDLELSHKIFLRLLGVRMDQFPASVGTLSAQLRSYETIRSFASSATLYVAVDTPFAILFVMIMWALAGPLLAIIPVIFFIVALSFGLFYRKRIARHAETGSAAANRKLGLLVEAVESAESIKANGAGWQVLNRWDVLSRQAVADDLKLRHYSESVSYVSASLQQVSYVALIASGAWITATTDLTIGGLIACSILSGRVLAPVAMLPGLLVQWGHAKVALDGLEKVFALETDNHDVERPLVPENVKGSYHLDSVKFAYPESPSTLAIESLNIKAGDKVAILGSVGVGKSTLLKVLAGLYKQVEGRVLLDGLEVQHLARGLLSERIGYLPQDVRLFGGTLRENLLCGLPAISDEYLLEVARKTDLISLVTNHPKGLDLEIAEGGGGISGGQKQLVALTRLLIAEPRIWLLDEPTAAMDELTEQRSLFALKHAIAEDQTLVLVTHKPILLKLVERIIVLTPNGISMDGPRDEVLKRLTRTSREKQRSGEMHKVTETGS